MSRAAKRRANTLEELEDNTTRSQRAFTAPKPASRPPAETSGLQPQGESEPGTNVPAEPAQKRRVQLLEDFEDNFDEIVDILLEHEADDTVGSQCACGRPGHISTTQCRDCMDYAAACNECFVERHQFTPFHWAEVWDAARGFFIRHDISKLDLPHVDLSGPKPKYILQLGHNGGQCSAPTGERLFTAVDLNGIHSTRLAFCGCREQPPNQVRQLLRAGLFPASTRKPLTAFTINVLKQFQLHNFESKKAAYDYLKAIRRLSDNMFTSDVANPYAAFLRVIRIYNYLTTTKRAGQFHGIDAALPHRPTGNILVWCPACPEPGLNSDPLLTDVPSELRHLNQIQRTMDGNFQCNQFSKNTDPDDVSLFNGRGYFPREEEYKSYLVKIPVSKEKSTCTYLTVVNKQDRKKFKNMSVTGTVNVQCSHVFILSTADLHHGERFSNADMALALELIKWNTAEKFSIVLKLEIAKVDKVKTYDIAYSCAYLFGTAYMACVGHFHGETAEQYWPEANQLGPHVRQMNNGHRQDTLINHHGDWNWKKTMALSATLSDDLALAKSNYAKKQKHLIGLSATFRDQMDDWRSMPRTSKKVGGELISVYRHNSTKVPSQQAIFQRLINDQATFARTVISKGVVANFIDEALKIQDLQRQLAALIADRTEHDLVSRQKEITNRTSKVQARLTAWRKSQKTIMPSVGDAVAAQSLVTPPIAVHKEKLFLPSDFPTSAERLKLELDDLGAEESRWREGQVFDILRALQNNVKGATAMRSDKAKNDRQQKQNTRAGDQIRQVLRLREIFKTLYHLARTALVVLDGSTRFPILQDTDLYMKPVMDKRRVGDSKLSDGMLWTRLG
ncbi:hypothetical protein C8F01DRAFT_1342934 [Mycena amicta]|nr:hypothetical protein C8F01DRAFT_1342934 [Mycena amicta]